MINKITIIGGDLRIVKLATMLAKEDNEIYVFGLEKAEDLKLDIEKLKDPDYLADYARETYLYTKDDEYVLQIEEIIETNEKIDKLTNKIDKNYIIFGLIFLIVLIFIYIIRKSNKKTTKK